MGMQYWGKAEFEPSPARDEIFYVLMFCWERYFSVEVNGETKKGNFSMWHFLNIQESSKRGRKSLESKWRGFRRSLRFLTLHCLGLCFSPGLSCWVHCCASFPKGAASQEPPYSILSYWTKHSSIFKRKFRASISETWLKRDGVYY